MTQTILFLCTGNSARSIMAECYMNTASEGKWRAYSAGSKPTGEPNRFALQTLAAHHINPAGGDGAPRSKSWLEFSGDDAPRMDVIVTVCDNAANEECPVWPNKVGIAPRKLHWGFPDPAAAEGSDAEKRTAFEAVFTDIRLAIDDFLATP